MLSAGNAAESILVAAAAAEHERDGIAVRELVNLGAPGRRVGQPAALRASTALHNG
jgi:hypothetical protein